MTWFFRLGSCERDVTAILELFREGARFVQEQGSSYLLLDLAEGMSCEDAQDAAVALLAKLNGVAHVVHGNHENVRIESTERQDTANGRRSQFAIGPRGIPSGLRFGIGGSVSVGGTTGAVESIGDLYLRARDKDDHFDRALYLYGYLPQDWRGLYMVLECIEDGNGGEKALRRRSWAKEFASNIKDFKRTACNYKAIGALARHGNIDKGAASEPLITLEAGKEMVRTLLERWAKEITRGPKQ